MDLYSLLRHFKKTCSWEPFRGDKTIAYSMGRNISSTLKQKKSDICPASD